MGIENGNPASAEMEKQAAEQEWLHKGMQIPIFHDSTFYMGPWIQEHDAPEQIGEFAQLQDIIWQTRDLNPESRLEGIIKRADLKDDVRINLHSLWPIEELQLPPEYKVRPLKTDPESNDSIYVISTIDGKTTWNVRYFWEEDENKVLNWVLTPKETKRVRLTRENRIGLARVQEILQQIDNLNPGARLIGTAQRDKDNHARFHIYINIPLEKLLIPSGYKVKQIESQPQNSKLLYVITTANGEMIGEINCTISNLEVPMLDQVTTIDDDDSRTKSSKVFEKYGRRLAQAKKAERIYQTIEKKSPGEIQAITELIDFVNNDRARRGLAPRQLSAEMFHKYTVESFPGVKNAVADYSAEIQRIRYKDNQTINTLLHECLHADSFQAAKEYRDTVTGKRYSSIRRVGTSLEGNSCSYFDLINEALTEGRTRQMIHESGQEAFFRQKLKNIEVHFDPQATSEVPHSDDLSTYLNKGAYQTARKCLDRYISHLIAAAPTPTTREEIYSEFIAAHATNEWKTIARRIDATLGAGSFAALGRASANAYDESDLSERMFENYLNLLDAYDEFLKQVTNDNNGYDLPTVRQVLMAAHLTPSGFRLPGQMAAYREIRDVSTHNHHDGDIPELAQARQLIDQAMGRGATDHLIELSKQPGQVEYIWRSMPAYRELVNLVAERANTNREEVQEIFKEAQITPLFWPLDAKQPNTLHKGRAYDLLRQTMSQNGIYELQRIMNAEEKLRWGKLRFSSEDLLDNAIYKIVLDTFTDEENNTLMPAEKLTKAAKKLLDTYSEELTNKNNLLNGIDESDVAERIADAIVPQLTEDLKDPKQLDKVLPFAEEIFGLHYFSRDLEALANFVEELSEDDAYNPNYDYEETDGGSWDEDERDDVYEEYNEKDGTTESLSRVFDKLISSLPADYREGVNQELWEAWYDGDMDVIAVAIDDVFGAGSYYEMIQEWRDDPDSLDSFLERVTARQQTSDYERDTRESLSRLNIDKEKRSTWARLKDKIKEIMGR